MMFGVSLARSFCWQSVRERGRKRNEDLRRDIFRIRLLGSWSLWCVVGEPAVVCAVCGFRFHSAFSIDIPRLLVISTLEMT
jgi:hypothetical protein